MARFNITYKAGDTLANFPHIFYLEFMQENCCLFGENNLV